MKKFFNNMKFAALGLVMGLGLLWGGHIALATFNPVGGGTYLLQASVSSTQSTITLTSFAEPGSGIPLTMAYMNSAIEYGAINPSSGNSEFISFTGVTQNANGTALLTGVTRGLSRTPGTGGCVASTTLAHAYPGQTQFILSNSPCYYSQYAVKQNNEIISGQWTFTTFPITPASPAASETTAGISQLSTAAQAAAGTSVGSSAFRLVLPGNIASSTFATSSANVVVITNSLNHIDGGFVSSSTNFSVSGTTTLIATSSTYVGSFPVYQIGKNLKVFSSTGTTTFTVPLGVGKVEVEVQGAGGGGAGSSGAAGGGGGYCYKIVDVSATTSVQVFVGSGGAAGTTGGAGSTGTWSTFGTNGFYCSANPGNGGAILGNPESGGAGGTATGGDINQTGGGGMVGSAATSNGVGGMGGSSHWGGGGPGIYRSTGASNGNAGGNYGGGGGSGVALTGNSDGGAGAQGIVIVRW